MQAMDELKIGDRVYCSRRGLGTLTFVPADDSSQYAMLRYARVSWDDWGYPVADIDSLEPAYFCSICGREVPESELAPGNLTWCARCELS